MAISHVSGGTLASSYGSHGTSPTFTYPSVTINAGDFILASLHAEDGTPGTVTPPSGFTAVGTHSGVHPNDSIYGMQFYKIAAGGESGTFQCGTSGSTSGIRVVSVYRSDTGTAALDAFGAWNSTTTGQNPTAQITTLTDAAMRVWFSINYNNSLTGIPSGFAARADVSNLMRIGDSIQATAGASGALTGSGNLYSWTRVVSIKDGETSAGGGQPPRSMHQFRQRYWQGVGGFGAEEWEDRDSGLIIPMDSDKRIIAGRAA